MLIQITFFFMDHLKLISIGCSDFFKRNEFIFNSIDASRLRFLSAHATAPVSLPHSDTKHQSRESLPYYAFLNFVHTLHITLWFPNLQVCCYTFTWQLLYLLQNGFCTTAIFKPNGVANLLAQHDIHLISHTLCHAHRSHSPGLGTSHSPLRAR